MIDSPTIFVVDDDEAIRESLQVFLETAGYRTAAYPSAKAFLSSYDGGWRGCLITDIRMPDMDGLELQAELNARNAKLPLIVVTGHGDVPLAVRAMRAGAIDFLEKPYDTEALLRSVRFALNSGHDASKSVARSPEVEEKLRSLTERERQVLDLVATGKLNKVIAHDLGISHRTVEVHRGRAMQKLGVHNLPGLIRLLYPVAD